VLAAMAPGRRTGEFRMVKYERARPLGRHPKSFPSGRSPSDDGMFDWHPGFVRCDSNPMVSIECTRVLEEFLPLRRWAKMMCNHGERQPTTSGEEMIRRSTPPRSGRLEPVWLWVEPAAALVIAVILFFPLKKKDLAELTGIFGILLTVSAIATTVRLRGEFDSVRKLSQAVDLSRTCNVQLINELFRLYLIIKEPELTPIKDDAVHACMAVLGKLAHDKVSPEMTSGEYYTWLLNVLATVPKGTRVNAVSVMAESSWTEIPAESRFLEANVAAAKRGVHIERIFITTRERMNDPNNRVVLSRHLEHENQGLSAYVVWEEELSKQDPSLLMDAEWVSSVSTTASHSSTLQCHRGRRKES
jgi:hypothetical protein